MFRRQEWNKSEKICRRGFENLTLRFVYISELESREKDERDEIIVSDVFPPCKSAMIRLYFAEIRKIRDFTDHVVEIGHMRDNFRSAPDGRKISFRASVFVNRLSGFVRDDDRKRQ